MSEIPTPTIPKLALSVAEAAETIGVSERQIYVLAARDGLPTIKLGGRRLIRMEDLKEWLAAQPAALPSEGQDHV